MILHGHYNALGTDIEGSLCTLRKGEIKAYH